MQSSVLPEKLNGPTSAKDDRSAINSSNDFVAVGELHVYGTPVPVYAVRRRKRIRSFTRAVLMKIWWSFARRFWPCAEPDDEW
jgi:hypothetical protein